MNSVPETVLDHEAEARRLVADASAAWPSAPYYADHALAEATVAALLAVNETLREIRDELHLTSMANRWGRS